MENTQTIQELQDFKTKVLDQLSNRDIVQFALNDLKFDNGQISVGGAILYKKALRQVCRVMKVTMPFLNYSNQMTPDDWLTVKNKIEQANANVKLFGKKIYNDKDLLEEITTIYPQSVVNESMLDYNQVYSTYFDYINLALTGSERPFGIETMKFDSRKEEVTLVFQDNENPFIIIPNSQDDKWVRGALFSFNQLNFKSFPYYGRLVCLNGLVDGTSRHSLEVKMGQKRYNLERIQKEINALLIKGKGANDQMLIDFVERLRSNNVSLYEFYDVKSFFDQRNEEGKYNHIIATIFNEKEIYQSYGSEVGKKSKKWLSTANSGRNAYDFINDITQVATHTSRSKIDPEDGTELQRFISKLFFKKNLDLSDIAPTTNIQIPKQLPDDLYIKN